MENSHNYLGTSIETIAAWLDGNLSPQEEADFTNRLSDNPELAEILDSCEDIETSYEEIIEGGFELPAELAFDFELPEIPSYDFEDDFNNQILSNDNYFTANSHDENSSNDSSYDQSHDDMTSTEDEFNDEQAIDFEEGTISDGFDMF